MAVKRYKKRFQRQPAQKNAIQRPIRLSQCMIVKNEERNIEKALSWAKGAAFEQIVVDTGSTDRTVEIAESMGAKVFRFEWTYDFAAAKNFAIEKAKGNWIAFLDADEYFPDADVKKLMQMLKNIENDPKTRNLKTAIRCPIVNLDESGKPFLILRQDRVFRNVPETRYIGKIHEYLNVEDTLLQAPELSIIHTGYTATAYEETNKAARNIELIKHEMICDPSNPELMCYLADSLRIEGQTQDFAEAERLYRKALASDGSVLRKELKQNAYSYLITTYYNDELKADENFDLCLKAYEEFPTNPDFCYYYGRKLHLLAEFQNAWEKLVECENLLKCDLLDMGGFVIRNPLILFFQMTLTAEELGDITEIIRCATLALIEDKYQPQMLAPYINAFNRPGLGYKTSADDLYDLLGKLYDFNNTKDKVTVLRAAKASDNMELVMKVLATFESEELEWLTKGM